MSKLVDKFYNCLRVLVAKHDEKVNPTINDRLICTRIDTRNRNKRDEYKIPEDKPQCPVFNDNRCCGGCSLGKTCDHCVDCGCYGYAQSIVGGIEIEMTHKASTYYVGRLDENGKFDWDYYWSLKDR